MENVAEKQETLYNLLTELENAKTEEEIERLRAEVQALKEKSDAALVLLHVNMILHLSVIIMSYSLSNGNIYQLRILFNCHIFDEHDEFIPNILQILYKINHELQYARKDLEEALKHTGGDILAARKRVMWLEDRMGTLCGKVRLRVRATFTVIPLILASRLISLAGSNVFLPII